MWNFSKFGHVYWRNPSWKTSVLVQCVQWFISLKGPLKQPKAALKIMKNAFYFTLKSYFFFKIFKFLSFCPDVYVENGLIKKLLVSKIVTSQTGKQIISIHVLSNVSRSIGNQIMTFGQFIEHNMRNIFLKKWYTECGGEQYSQTHFWKSKLSISLNQQSEMLYRLFLFYV